MLFGLKNEIKKTAHFLPAKSAKLIGIEIRERHKADVINSRKICLQIAHGFLNSQQIMLYFAIHYFFLFFTSLVLIAVYATIYQRI